MEQTAVGWATRAQTNQPANDDSHLSLRRWLPGLTTAFLALFAGLGIWYAMMIPPFETPDEVYHYAFARHLAQGHGLPVQDEGASGPWQHEGSQAPLYYWLVGRLTSAVDQQDFAELTLFNPRSNMGNPLYAGNKNRMLYSAASRPLRGTNLALHIGRYVSTLLGLVTLAFLLATARLAFPEQDARPLIAVGLAAVIPQFVFISASFSNDNMIIATAAATLYALARLLTMDDDVKITNVAWLCLGLLLGLAALSKLQGLGLWLLAGGMGCWLAWRRHEIHLLPKIALLAMGPALAIAGWWYWRNYSLYGDWIGMTPLVSINGLRNEPLDWGDFWHEFRGLRYSFWGLFGWFNILLPSWFYRVMDGVVALAAFGFVLRLLSLALNAGRRTAHTGREIVSLVPGAFPAGQVDKPPGQPPRVQTAAGQARADEAAHADKSLRVLLLAALWLSLLFGLFLYWMTRAESSQGRLFFPALSAAMIALVAGLDFWLSHFPRWLTRVFWTSLFLLLLGSVVYGGAILLPQSYGPPPIVRDLPKQAQAVGLLYGDRDQIELVGITTPDAQIGHRFYAGEEVPVTLYLRATTRVARDHELFIQLLDEHGEVLGNVTSHPGWGRHPTSLWQPDTLYEDAYLVRVEKSIGDRSPLLARVYVGFVDAGNDEDDMTPMVARNADGVVVTPFVAQVSLVPRQPAQLKSEGVLGASMETRDVGALFGDSIRIVQRQTDGIAQPGRVITATILWEAVSEPATEYVGFVHLLDEHGVAMGGFDRAPADDRYPTSYWRPGDRIVSDSPIQLPPDLASGRYGIWAGIYAASSQGAARLPVTDANGNAVANNMVLIGEVTLLGE